MQSSGSPTTSETVRFKIRAGAMARAQSPALDTRNVLAHGVYLDYRHPRGQEQAMQSRLVRRGNSRWRNAGQRGAAPCEYADREVLRT